MQKNYLDFLTLKCKNFSKKYKEIFDIVVYGSFIRGKEEPRDIDLLVIFTDISLKERLVIAQNLKEELKKELKNYDVKNINLNELFENNFLAKQGVLIDGFSLLYEKSFSERIGFKGYSIFSYVLKNLSHNNKTRFTYSLIGRGDKLGILKIIGAKSMGRGAFLVPADKSLIFEEFLKQWEVNYNKRDILLST